MRIIIGTQNNSEFFSCWDFLHTHFYWAQRNVSIWACLEKGERVIHKNISLKKLTFLGAGNVTMGQEMRQILLLHVLEEGDNSAKFRSVD